MPAQSQGPARKKVISASRRTDLPALFPEWLAGAMRAGEAIVLGPSGRARTVDLRPGAVHTLVLWSKDFSILLADRHGLRAALKDYDQAYLLFTITGLGGTTVESGVVSPDEAMAQLEPLVELVGRPKRISVRFDPIVYWRESGKLRTNIRFFDTLAPRIKAAGIRDVRVSFTQWYGKARRRAGRAAFDYIDPSEDEKRDAARYLADTAAQQGLSLFSCAQNFLAEVPGFRPSACIDGRLLQELHPRHEVVSWKKDKTQRQDCGCTESVDIGSYTQACPHACLYCYANPRL